MIKPHMRENQTKSKKYNSIYQNCINNKGKSYIILSSKMRIDIENFLIRLGKLYPNVIFCCKGKTKEYKKNIEIEIESLRYFSILLN